MYRFRSIYLRGGVHPIDPGHHGLRERSREVAAALSRDHGSHAARRMYGDRRPRSADPGRGPGAMVGNGERIDGPFPGGNDPRQSRRRSGEVCLLGPVVLRFARPHEPGEPGHLHEHVGPRHGQPHRRQAGLSAHLPDLLGRFPTPVEINDRCTTGSFGSLAWDLMTTEEFLLVQRRQADQLLYNNRAVSIHLRHGHARHQDLRRLRPLGSVRGGHPVASGLHPPARHRWRPRRAAFKLFSGRPLRG